MKFNDVIIGSDAYPRLAGQGSTQSSSTTTNNALEIHTGSGYLRVGPQNTSYCHMITDRSNFYFNQQIIVDSGIVGSYNEDLVLRRATNSSHQITVTTAKVTTPLDIELAGGMLTRTSHHTGHFEGSYNNVGANGSKSNPIYTIGSSYNPNESTLSNMYGIGYSHGNQASFVSIGGATGWGLYVAADGDARIFLDGSYGHVVSTGEHFSGGGNATTPGYTFTGDQNTGMFGNGADNIGFSTNGINRVNVSNTKLALLAGLGLDLETSSGNVRGLIAAFESAPHLRIATSGNESIGFYDGGTSGTQNVDISGAGALTVRDNITAYGSFSDIRLKENIEAIPDAIQKVQKLEGVTFNYKKDGSRSTGLIAQQLQEVLPEVVYETKDLDTQETHYAVRYGNVVGLLVEAIKEQQTQLTAQQEQINQLTNLVNILMEK